MMQPRPLGPRKTVQLMVILTILAWATQTLFHQWGFGGIIFPNAPQAQSLDESAATVAQNIATTQPSFTLSEIQSPDAAPVVIDPQASAKPQAEGVQAAIPQQTSSPTLELRSEVTVDGSEVTLKQLCRWQDDQTFATMGDTVVARLSQTNPVRQIGIDEIKSALHDAGANLSQIQFSGAATCAVRRSEVDDATFARLLASDGSTRESATTQPVNVTEAEAIAADTKQTPLVDLLMTDLSDKFKVPADQLDVHFDVRNQGDLLLTSPRCRFDIDSQRITTLGAVSWDVTIHSPNGQRSTTIVGTAHAWQNQLVLTRPLSQGQTVLAKDVTSRRSLVDDINGPAIATDPSQLVGQVLARDMKKGDVLLIESVKSPPLVVQDQFVTVSIPHQGITIQTVARALDSGAKGETIRARNEATNEVYSVVVTDKASGEIKSRGEQDVASAPRDSATER